MASTKSRWLHCLHAATKGCAAACMLLPAFCSLAAARMADSLVDQHCVPDVTATSLQSKGVARALLLPAAVWRPQAAARSNASSRHSTPSEPS